jgi:hypothetical protein
MGSNVNFKLFLVIGHKAAAADGDNLTLPDVDTARFSAGPNSNTLLDVGNVFKGLHPRPIDVLLF